MSDRTAAKADRFTRRQISDKAAQTIDAWVAALALDELSLAALPAPLFSLYNLGVLDGRAQLQDDLRAARLEADRLWLRAFGDQERQEYLLARLDDAASLANRPDIDDVLDEAWRIYVANLDTLRAPVRIKTTENRRSSHEHAA